MYIEAENTVSAPTNVKFVAIKIPFENENKDTSKILSRAEQYHKNVSVSVRKDSVGVAIRLAVLVKKCILRLTFSRCLIDMLSCQKV